MSRNEKAQRLWSKSQRARSKKNGDLAVIFIFIACIFAYQVQSLELDSAFCRCETGSSLFRKPFVVLWNSPTEGCRVNFSVNIDLEKFGILTNTNQTWDGEVVTVFYNAQLGLYPYFYEENLNSTNNGGLPQLINITKHLSKASEDIIAKIPDADFSGVSVIDWEGWRPLWVTNFGKKRIYQTKSIELVKKENVLKKKDDIASEAKKRFENAAREIMESTVKLARKLRPKALWGFYGFPGCHGYMCTKENKQWNDDVEWLYESSTALFPSIYLMEEHVQNRKFVAERLSEAFRVSLHIAHKAKHNLPVFPYLRPLYLTTSHDFKMLNEDDLENAIGQAADLGCAGLILWGNHHDERTSKAICSRYKNYVKKKLGPYISLLTEELETCSKTKCFSNGRCIDRSIVPSGLLNYEQHNVNKNYCNLINNAHRAFKIESKSSPVTTLNESTAPLAKQETRTGYPTRKNVTLVIKNNKIQLKKSKLHKRNGTKISSKETAKEEGQRTKSFSKQSSLLKLRDHKTKLLDSSPNKTHHKKIPFDPYWNKNGILGSNKVPQTKVDREGHLISVNISNKSKHVKDQKIRTHMRHSVTEGIYAKRSHKMEKSTHKNKNSNPDQLSSKANQPRKPGYSSAIPDDTSVRVPSVYIILITVTIGGALLMTIIYVAIYYAVNVRGRSHDHSYDYTCASSDENPFSIDGSPWCHKNIDEEEKLLKGKDEKKDGNRK